MGILDQLGLGKRALDRFGIADQLGLSSPWAEGGDLQQVVLSDIFGPEVLDSIPLTRADAISIPAVSKARNLLVSTVAKFPLVAMRGAAVLDDSDQPTFLYRTNGNVSPYDRMAWTVDDLIFYGTSLWLTDRGAPDAKSGRRAITDATWCPQSQWTITKGHILVNEQEVDEEDVLLFNSPFEGLLNIANRTLRGARDQEQAWVGRSQNPVPVIELHQTDDSLTADQVAKFVAAWSKARRSPLGAIGYTPEGLELKVHGDVAVDLMIEGRNAVRTDVGSFLNVRAAMLDGTIGVDSLTYTTAQGERNSFYEFDLPFWVDPIAARLSMDDVVPRSVSVHFDMYNTLNAPASTGPTVED